LFGWSLDVPYVDSWNTFCNRYLAKFRKINVRRPLFHSDHCVGKIRLWSSYFRWKRNSANVLKAYNHRFVWARSTIFE
jgi:hypothetical protein